MLESMWGDAGTAGATLVWRRCMRSFEALQVQGLDVALGVGRAVHLRRGVQLGN